MTNRHKSRVNVHSKLTAVSSKPFGPGKTYPLSSLDHAMGLHRLHVIFYYGQSPFSAFDLDPLRVSLSEILSSYPKVTGRLNRDKVGNWEIKCNDAGLRILRAKVETTIDEWLRLAVGSEERDLTVWEDMPEDPNTWSPFLLQITDFEGGGVSFGLSCLHMLADPASVTLLFKSWIEAHHGQPITHSPSYDPLTNRGQPVPCTTNTKSSNYYANKANAQAPSVKMSTATFKFSNSVIKQCISGIHGEFPGATPFDLLTALFWTRVACLKAPKYDNKHSLSICLDFRGILQEPLPYGYFGNALHFSQLSVTEAELDCNCLGALAGLVHRHVLGIREEEIWSAIDWFESQKGEGGKYAAPFRMYGPELTCVSMEHMILGDESLMYAAMFDKETKPLHVTYHVGNVEGEGLIIVTASPEAGLARTVMVTLLEEEIDRLCEDQAIMQLKPTMLVSGGR